MIWRGESWCDFMRIRQHIGNVDIDISDARLRGNLKEAQKLLNMQIVADCDPLIPFQQGALRGSVEYPDGIYGGTIQWGGASVGVPYAAYQYRGEIYGPNIPIKDDNGNVVGWYSPPKKNPTGRKLQYHTPGTTDHFFEEAKRIHGREWIDLVKRTVGKE